MDICWRRAGYRVHSEGKPWVWEGKIQTQTQYDLSSVWHGTYPQSLFLLVDRWKPPYIPGSSLFTNSRSNQRNGLQYQYSQCDKWRSRTISVQPIFRWRLAKINRDGGRSFDEKGTNKGKTNFIWYKITSTDQQRVCYWPHRQKRRNIHPSCEYERIPFITPKLLGKMDEGKALSLYYFKNNLALHQTSKRGTNCGNDYHRFDPQARKQPVWKPDSRDFDRSRC